MWMDSDYDVPGGGGGVGGTMTGSGSGSGVGCFTGVFAFFNALTFSFLGGRFGLLGFFWGFWVGGGVGVSGGSGVGSLGGRGVGGGVGSVKNNKIRKQNTSQYNNQTIFVMLFMWKNDFRNFVGSTMEISVCFDRLQSIQGKTWFFSKLTHLTTHKRQFT